jgi:flavodoxin I
MSKVAIVFWSATGNTETMANCIAEGTGANGIIVPCTEMTPAKLAEFDVVAFGCPAMGAEQLEESEFEPMFAALEGSLNGKKIALFGSYGWGDGQWMRDWAQTTKTQIACRNIAGKGEQHCGDSKPCCGWNVPQWLFQKAGQQHSAAQQGQHTKDNSVLRHKKQRDCRDKRACPEHLCAPAQGMMPQLRAEAGQQNKHPADALLPQMPGQTIIPVGLNTEEIDQIPAAVIEHHTDQIQPTQLVQKGIAVRSVMLLHSIFLPICHAVTPFSGAAGSWAAAPGWAWCIFPWREGCFPPAPLLRSRSIPG